MAEAPGIIAGASQLAQNGIQISALMLQTRDRLRDSKILDKHAIQIQDFISTGISLQNQAWAKDLSIQKQFRSILEEIKPYISYLTTFWKTTPKELLQSDILRLP